MFTSHLCDIMLAVGLGSTPKVSVNWKVPDGGLAGANQKASLPSFRGSVWDTELSLTVAFLSKMVK